MTTHTRTPAHAHTPTPGQTPDPAPTTRVVDFADGLSIEVEKRGAGRPVLLLHGGAGPQSVAGFAALLAEEARVFTPIHPGFSGRPRPDRFDGVDDLALAYLDLLARFGARDVTVIGSSLGGWIAAEMALRDTAGLISRIVLIDAAGIRVDESNPREIADVASLGPAELGRLSFYDPALRPDPATMPPELRAAMAANMQTLAVYAGDPYMHDPKLRRRLHRVRIPALVVWGEHDGVIGPDYGRAYAASFPNARFELIPEAGHLPQLEQPERVLAALREFAAAA